MEFYSLLFENFETNLLVFARVLGIFAFNPILSRRNIPTIVKVGCCLLITIITVSVLHPETVDSSGPAGVYLLMLLREGFIGAVLGFITDMFFFSVQMGGEIMDMQAGLGMAKVFDPESKIQMSVMGSFISFMMYLYFFVTNCHMTYIRLFVDSFNIIPLGVGGFNTQLGWILVEYFSVVLTLVMKLAMPIIVSQMIVQFCIGVLMKSVPQIQLMVVNIQIKVGFGFIMLYIIAVPMASFIDKYMGIWLETLEGVIPLIPAQ